MITATFTIAEFLKRRKELQVEADAARFAELTCEYVSTQLFPGMIENSLQGLTGAFVGEFGLSKAEAIRACQLVTAILANGAADAFSDPDMPVAIPPTFVEIREKGVEEFIRENWPDGR
jgi:hypothetical protein